MISGPADVESLKIDGRGDVRNASLIFVAVVI
jgi:hypothetical protein